MHPVSSISPVAQSFLTRCLLVLTAIIYSSSTSQSQSPKGWSAKAEGGSAVVLQGETLGTIAPSG